MSLPSSTLFPEGTSSEQIIKMTLVVLQAHYQREADRLAEVLSGIDQLYIDKLSALWEELLTRYKPGDALATLTKIVAAELDGGDSPAPYPSGSDKPSLKLIDY